MLFERIMRYGIGYKSKQSQTFCVVHEKIRYECVSLSMVTLQNSLHSKWRCYEL